MKSIVFICPYFGTLPKEHMELWLQSCSKNTDINWIIFTDDKTEYTYPANVRAVYMSFDEAKVFFQSKFDFTLHLDRAYKLCDFKPTYGYVFSEYIGGYDFWGHCDMSDCIFGNLRKFITDDMLDKNDKIGFLGHMTLYRNAEDVNKRFMLGTKAGVSLESILGVSENKAFDELPTYGINQIYKEHNFNMARFDDAYVDISPLRFAFQPSRYDLDLNLYYEKKIPMVFEWDDGQLFELTVSGMQVQRREIGYLHFQKRAMKKVFVGTSNHYYIVPNNFIEAEEPMTVKAVKSHSKDKLYSVFFRLKWEALKYHIRELKK